ncbi:HNH endonuclease [Actinosynnema sp. NPDC053489]|uniref:HNH endonuclease n=1 Tax=Actinosynnema sp. NPDC053489 TaxID=3363916 RepID=UPI0037C8B353
MILPASRPRRDPITDYDTARSRRKANATKQTLLAARAEVLNAYSEYIGSGGSSSKLSPLSFADETIMALKSNYDLTYASGPLADLRDDILTTAFNGRCPMCGERQASTLDHYLPRDKYPEFSILALNLIPACMDCNHRKSNFTSAGNGGRFVHAYLDEIDATLQVLEVYIDAVDDVLVIDFDVNSELPQELYANLAVQFEQLRLAEFYSWAATEELIQRHESFREAFYDKGHEEVSRVAHAHGQKLRDTYGSHYWKVALYRAVEHNSEFCRGAFELLMRD